MKTDKAPSADRRSNIQNSAHRRSVAAHIGFDDWRKLTLRLDDTGVAYESLRGAVAQANGDATSTLQELANSYGTTSAVSLRIRAAALLLRDLILIGYEIRCDKHWIFVRTSTASSAGGPTKDAIRRNLEHGRNDQLREIPTRRFIIGMERPQRGSGNRPVTDLIADGRRLAEQVRTIRDQGRQIRGELLAEVCSPYLQLVEPGARDEHTNLRLSDIWRYFRHMWSIRYRSTPGRNLYYLVRDRAQPNHPVIAITALGNSVMQLRCRDEALGWTENGVRRLIASGIVADEEVVHAFRSRLSDDIADIYSADLPAVDIHNVSDDFLDRLALIEREATLQRTGSLKDDQYVNAVQRISDVNLVDLESLAKTPLFRSKRARALRDLCRAFRAFSTVSATHELVGTPEGEWALGQALRQLKKRHAASSIMEITVCGAVPPYNQLLGGKLACLLMMSPRVVQDYDVRYRDGYSIIASQMAGRLIRKAPNLAFLATSSLYTERSSQYNRVRIPNGTLPGQTAGVSYDVLGYSGGYGSLNLSAETESALESLSAASKRYRSVNFVFGEGQSPKFRQIREALDILGIGQSDLLNHGAQRIVYGVRLAKNVERYLLDVDSSPLNSIDAAEATSRESADAEIARYWTRRWLASRLDYSPAIESVGRSTPITERVSRLIPELARGKDPGLFDPVRQEMEALVRETWREDEKAAFIRQLYRDESAYSDNVKLSRLRELNIKTRVDDVVRRVIKAGGSVVITGNAGDGKTHVVRLLEQELKNANAVYIVDASEHSYADVITLWTDARTSERPFCIAINEGLLVDLIREYRNDQPWLDAIQNQLLNAVRLVPVDTEIDEMRFRAQPGATVVLDLSYRRTLAPGVVAPIIEKLTDESWYTGCCRGEAAVTCPVRYNREMLRTPQVRDRVVALLNRVAERGVRATFREVLAFVSFLIFGGRSCAELRATAEVEQTRYYWLAFEGQGLIFEQLESGLDPLRQTHPRIDEALWRGQLNPEEFVGHDLAPMAVRDLDEVQGRDNFRTADAFVALKRRWYFEHPDGHLSHATRADEFFSELQDRSSAVQLRVGRLLALINKSWNKADQNLQERLRLWTRLSYSPRASGKAMVSGRDVANMRLGLFKPQLSPQLNAAFGLQAVDYLILAPTENQRYASLVIDRTLLVSLISGGFTERGDHVARQLAQFNDALAQYAEVGSHVRAIELVDPTSELAVKVRVDLSQRRYDSAV